MITEIESSADGHSQWVVRPNRSMTWAEAKLFVVCVAAVSLAIGTYFLIRGFPLVLPFSGLEALAVAVAFYLVMEAGEHREVISISADEVIVEKGKRRPTSTAVFARAWVRVDLRQSGYRWHPSRLLLTSHGNDVEIGKFLTDGEREALAESLINAIAKSS